MRQCLYISTALTVDDREVGEIVSVAQANNARDGISGFLLYNGRNFMQLIEGDEGAIGTLLVKLASDKRHTGIVLLADNPIAAPVCPDWAMQQVSLDHTPDARREAIAAVLPSTLQPGIRETVLAFALLN